MIYYNMQRGGKTVANVVTLDNGKCVVSWPTSVIVYDSEEAARAVHIDHMQGRGEETCFAPICGTGRSFQCGMECATMDFWEGCWFGTITNNYQSFEPIAPEGQDAESFIAGYRAAMMQQVQNSSGFDDQLKRWVTDQQESRAQRKAKEGDK